MIKNWQYKEVEKACETGMTFSRNPYWTKEIPVFRKDIHPEQINIDPALIGIAVKYIVRSFIWKVKNDEDVIDIIYHKVVEGVGYLESQRKETHAARWYRYLMSHLKGTTADPDVITNFLRLAEFERFNQSEEKYLSVFDNLDKYNPVENIRPNEETIRITRELAFRCVNLEKEMGTEEFKVIAGLDGYLPSFAPGIFLYPARNAIWELYLLPEPMTKVNYILPMVYKELAVTYGNHKKAMSAFNGFGIFDAYRSQAYFCHFPGIDNIKEEVTIDVIDAFIQGFGLNHITDEEKKAAEVVLQKEKERLKKWGHL